MAPQHTHSTEQSRAEQRERAAAEAAAEAGTERGRVVQEEEKEVRSLVPKFTTTTIVVNRGEIDHRNLFDI